MKKYFFIVGLAAFCVVSAQEYKSLDIQKYFQKKQASQKPVGRLFLDSPKKTIPIYLPQNPPQAWLIQTLPNGNKVYSLPQDNMPCIEPDMNLYSGNMIQAPKKLELFNKQQLYKKHLPGAIPNPAFPLKIPPDNRK